VRFAIKASSVERGAASFNIDSDGLDVTTAVAFGALLTRDELAAGELSVEKVTFGSTVDPPIPDG